jgi:hypothetical protein
VAEIKSGQKTNVGEDVEQLNFSRLSGGNVELPLQKAVRQFPQKQARLPNSPTIARLGIYPRDMKIYVHTQNPDQTCT